jgi:hypothetical protein
MAVESLAIVEGPLAGLGLNPPGPLSEAAAWMRAHDINPWWVAVGAVGGAILGGSILGGAAKGALMLGALSWVCARTCR